MKIKTLLAAALMTAALSGCGDIIDEAELIPGAAEEMIAVCAVNGGFERGWTTPANLYFHGTASVQQYRTMYHVKCSNGARLDRIYLGKKQPN